MSGWVEKVTLEGEPYFYNESQKKITWEKPEELMTKQELDDMQGDWVWVPHPDLLWQPARVVSKDGENTKVVTERGKKMTIPSSGVMEGMETSGRKQKVPLWDLSRSDLRLLEDDLVMLGSVNEAIISYTLRTFYESNVLYTWVGAAQSVLISVNPYKWITGLYDSNQVARYKNPPPNQKLGPHPFAIAANSYNSLLNDAKNQSILISGESGAGKTEATKQCLNWLADVAGSESSVEEKILQANPLLEAFGNAKTIRNNNSSRFGKWIEVYFDGSTSQICGASINNYLLERSRVVYQQKNERNFHVFYQMCQSRELSSKYNLKDPNEYHYLNQSGLIKAHDVDDEGDLNDVLEALDKLEFSEDEVDWIMRTTVAVLNLGNVVFKPVTGKGGVRASEIKDTQPVEAAADLLGVDTAALKKVLLNRSISVRRETSVIPLDPTTARDSCDSLAKGVYSKLFDYLVERINESLEGRVSRFIGVLDIFGFEIFENNSFEQLCINFANEKLQQHFNATTFKEEEALYQSEGIDFQHVEFIDNQVVLDLIEAKPLGILLMLDEEAIIPEGSNIKLMNKMESQHKRNPKFQVDTHRRLNQDLSFEIVHYAGVVKYDAELMMQKNVDNLYADMQNCLNKSSDARTSKLYPEESRTQIKSVSNKFRRQLDDLMQVLGDTDSRYIRCVKPNNEQRSDLFVTPLVIEQLRYSGVFEAVQIRKQGYPFRLSYRQFRCRYACINQGYNYRSRNDRDVCEEILESSPFTFNDMQFGKNLILYRAPEHKLLQLLRNLALESIVPICQKVIRGGVNREFVRRLREATEKIAHALSVANDIDLMEEAINAVDKIIGPLSKINRQKPVNLDKAKRARDDLAKWVELENIFDRLTKVENPNESQFKELSDAVARASKLLDIPRTDRQVELYDLARSQVIYFSIKLEEQTLDKNPAKYQLSKYGKLRPPLDYAKSKMFGKQKAAEQMLVWQKAPIPSSLLETDDKQLVKLAKSAFKNMLIFAGDKKSKDPDLLGRQVVEMGIANPTLRDEIFSQILKQLQSNPDENSANRYWGLLGICLSCFTPSEDLELFVLAQSRKSDDAQRFASAFHGTKYGKPATSAPGNMTSAISAFFDNKDRSRFSVMPGKK